jgi:hypothetical protein
MRGDARTRRYVERRVEQGLSKPEILRCLKRYIAREMYRCLQDAHIARLASAALDKT